MAESVISEQYHGHHLKYFCFLIRLPLYNNIIHLKTKNMYYNQSCAAKGNYGDRQQHLSIRSMQRAAVNIFKTDNSYEMLVFAPGRIRENFNLDVKGMS